jgi:hypothetical protein
MLMHMVLIQMMSYFDITQSNSVTQPSKRVMNAKDMMISYQISHSGNKLLIDHPITKQTPHHQNTTLMNTRFERLFRLVRI